MNIFPMHDDDPEIAANKPTPIEELRKLQQDGSLDKARSMIQSGADVWMRRSNGQWQQCKAFQLILGGLEVGLAWQDPKEGSRMKHVPVSDFLYWQTLRHGNTPSAFADEIMDLEHDGSMDRIRGMIDNRTEAWVRRDNNSWQKGTVTHLYASGSLVVVKWYDRDERKDMAKMIPVRDFLHWQEEQIL
ncbi:MAG: hypothetical protein US89_C0007G0009 [Candidatus Peregrinibacteria bacterium GW2011_GWF2_38_29]|nr:MAG: hypothetical protein US89_C0007G0009 [Candidatus Peregrinibacteria bacterium GW2011_GWF2_38_29]HBB02827.1 hypothetical protein [Candidatus Peregrinibacteria bacterium]